MKRIVQQLRYIFNTREKVKLVFILIIVVIGSFFELIGVSSFMPFIEILMDPAVIHENEYLNFFMSYFILLQNIPFWQD